jgi:hypothetical protein
MAQLVNSKRKLFLAKSEEVRADNKNRDSPVCMTRGFSVSISSCFETHPAAYPIQQFSRQGRAHLIT